MYKAFEHRDAVRRKPLHALAKGQRVAVKALGEHTVRKRLLELLGVLKVRRLAALAHIAEFGDEQQAVARDIIEQTFGLFVELTDKLVGVGEHGAAAQPLRLAVEPLTRLGSRLAAQQPCLTGDFVRQRGAVADDDFGGGRQPYLPGFFEAALGLRIEIAQIADLVSPELGAHRIFAVGHKKVENAAAQRELSAAVHGVKPLVAQQRQRAHRPVDGNLGSLGKVQHRVAQHLPRHRQLTRRVHAGNRHVTGAVEELEQHLEALMLIFVRAAADFL